MTKDHYILVKGPQDKAKLQIIRNTINVFRKSMQEYKEGTCNQSLYIDDVEFLIKLLEGRG